MIFQGVYNKNLPEAQQVLVCLFDGEGGGAEELAVEVELQLVASGGLRDGVKVLSRYKYDNTNSGNNIVFLYVFLNDIYRLYFM